MMARNDHYGSISELIRCEEEGEDYEIDIREEDRCSRVLVIAPHGGAIECHTDELARKIAGNEFTYYAFRGIKSRHNYDLLHVTSTNFDEPQAVRLAEQAEVVLAVHGKSGDGSFAMVGGRHPELVDQVAEVIDDLGLEVREPTEDVGGECLSNICNRCREGGVQLELSKPLRKRFQRDPVFRGRFAQRLRRLLRDAVSEPR